MRSFKYPLFIILVAASFLVAGASASKRKIPGKGFVVVELFTSEGCSSCPPADAVAAKLQKENEDKPVYILAYHVDYWDRGGWKDAFSSAAYSDRQKQYARWLHPADGVYTPQVVVDGKTEFVGSDENTLRKNIQNSLQQTSSDAITLRNIKTENGNIILEYLVQGAAKTSVLQIALIQKTGQTKVKGGENGGRTLSHVQIVRAMQNVSLRHADGRTAIAIPAGFDTHGAELIAFVQDTQSGVISGAVKSAL